MNKAHKNQRMALNKNVILNNNKVLEFAFHFHVSKMEPYSYFQSFFKKQTFPDKGYILL